MRLSLQGRHGGVCVRGQSWLPSQCVRVRGQGKDPPSLPHSSIILFAPSLSSSWCSCGGVIPPRSAIQCSNTLPLTPPENHNTHTLTHRVESIRHTLSPTSPYSAPSRQRPGHEGIWTELLKEGAGDGLLKMPWGGKKRRVPGLNSSHPDWVTDTSGLPLGPKDCINIVLFSFCLVEEKRLEERKLTCTLLPWRLYCMDEWWDNRVLVTYLFF